MASKKALTNAVSLKKAFANLTDAVIRDQIGSVVVFSDLPMKLAAGHPPKSRQPRRRLPT